MIKRLKASLLTYSAAALLSYMYSSVLPTEAQSSDPNEQTSSEGEDKDRSTTLSTGDPIILKPNSTKEDRQKAEAILQNVSEFYSKLKSFSCVLTSNTVINFSTPGAQDVKLNESVAVSMKRPNKFSIVGTAEPRFMDEFSDGKTLSIYRPESNKYVQTDADSSVQEVFHNPEFHYGYAGLKNSALDALLSEKPLPWTSFSAIQTNDEIAYIDSETLDGVSVDKLRIVAPKFCEYIYVERSKNPWIKRVSITDFNVADLPMPRTAPHMRLLSTTVNYKNLAANPKLDAGKFEFTVPSGAAKVDTFLASQPVSPLIGTVAANFTGEVVDGKPVTLSQFKNKNVVMIDFWTTWCGPCRQALPLVSQVAANYKHKGVKFYAVNEQEDEDTIKTFLKNNNLPASIIRDLDGSMGGHYKVQAIPTTVIIDRKGIIRAVHTGFTQNIEAELSKDLDLALGLKKKK